MGVERRWLDKLTTNGKGLTPIGKGITAIGKGLATAGKGTAPNEGGGWRGQPSFVVPLAKAARAGPPAHPIWAPAC